MIEPNPRSDPSPAGSVGGVASTIGSGEVAAPVGLDSSEGATTGGETLATAALGCTTAGLAADAAGLDGGLGLGLLALHDDGCPCWVSRIYPVS